jgi:NAD(P)-dependent dehydrogenase (short-subunit alcohol dehydrogenase family)
LKKPQVTRVPLTGAQTDTQGAINMRLKPVEEQVVVLMGASSGIGRETALRFAKRGAKVVISARGEQGLNSLVDEIRHSGGEAVAVPADASDYEQVKASR